MATYPVENKNTGERKEVKLSIHEWDEWREQNPDWFRFYTPENTPGMGSEIEGDWRNKLMRSKPGWKDIMEKTKRNAPRNHSIAEKY